MIRVRNILWPRAGVVRAGKYIAHRVARLPGTPYSIAAGFAAGAAVSFTPFLGLHFLLGALLALAIGGNVIASAIGTAVGNPWTFPLIWSSIYALGRWLLGYGDVAELPDGLSLSLIFEHPWDILYPMIVGGLPTAALAWLLFFWPCYKAVQRYQAIRQARRLRAERRRRGRSAGNAYQAKGERG